MGIDSLLERASSGHSRNCFFFWQFLALGHWFHFSALAVAAWLIQNKTIRIVLSTVVWICRQLYGRPGWDISMQHPVNWTIIPLHQENVDHYIRLLCNHSERRLFKKLKDKRIKRKDDMWRKERADDSCRDNWETSKITQSHQHLCVELLPTSKLRRVPRSWIILKKNDYVVCV